LLESHGIAVVTMSDVLKTKDIRIEADFHIANRQNFVKSCLGEEIIEHAQYNSTYGLNDIGDGYPILRMHEFDGIFTGTPKIYFNGISKEKFEELRLKKDDILICRTNGNPQLIGKSAIVPKNYPYIYESHLFKIRVKEELINAATIVTFLNTKYGRQEIDKHSMVGNQANFSIAKFKELKFPVFNSTLQIKIRDCISESFESLNKSRDRYLQAETLLLETLGLSNFEPSKEPVNVKGFKESFLTTGRLDAEYYQKKYDNLEKAICSSNFKRIRELRTVNYRGMQPEYVGNGNLDIINSKHILEDTLDYNGFEKTSDDYWEIQERARVFKGDILTYTTGANIGRTQVYRLNKKALASNHVNILRVKEENPFYIGFVLNSMVGRMQTEKYCAGSAQVELYPKDLDEFIIPIIDKTIQKHIIELTEESFNLKKQSEQLLETAKRAVEIAIEQNEEAAMQYMLYTGIK
jgi:restriction endonuclease S subunit